MAAAIARLTLGIAAETLFGADVDDEADTIGRALDEAMESFPISLTPIGELLDHLPWVPIVRRFLDARAQLDAIVYRLIDARRAADRRAAEHAAPDVLGMLLAAGDAEGGMDIEQIRDEAMTIFLAGHETTAMALTWTWWLLAQHPDVEALLRAELATVLAGRSPTVGDVPALRYTRDVIAESMRLYPPAWIVGRRAIEDAPLGRVDRAEGLDRAHEPVDHPPRPALLARTRPRSGPSAGRTARPRSCRNSPTSPSAAATGCASARPSPGPNWCWSWPRSPAAGASPAPTKPSARSPPSL